jgi:hypothetical protein
MGLATTLDANEDRQNGRLVEWRLKKADNIIWDSLDIYHDPAGCKSFNSWSLNSPTIALG